MPLISVVVGITRDGVTVYADFVMPIVVFVVATLIEGTGAYETLELVVERLDVLKEEKVVPDGPIEVELLEIEVLEVEEAEDDVEEVLDEAEGVERDLIVDERTDEDDDTDDEVIELDREEIYVLLDTMDGIGLPEGEQVPGSVPFV